MGTSSRKIDNQIKKYLKDKSKINVEDIIPELAVEVLTKRKMTDFFSDRDFETVLGVGLNALGSMFSGKFQEEFGYQGDIDDNPLTIQQIVDAILTIIEARGENIDSELLLRSLRSGLTKAIKDGETDEQKFALFVEEFCFYLLYLLILESTIEALRDVYPEESMPNVDTLIKDSARRIVTTNLIGDIRKLITGQINVASLISIIKDNANKIKVGEF